MGVVTLLSINNENRYSKMFDKQMNKQVNEIVKYCARDLLEQEFPKERFNMKSQSLRSLTFQT